MRKPYTKGSITMDELLRDGVRTSRGCLEWPYSTARSGYGQIRRNKKLITISRLIMHFTSGFDLNNDLNILHKCDNPKCINPEHLYTGTVQQNIKDKMDRDRHNRGRRVWKAKLHDHDISFIFNMRSEGWKIKAIAEHYGISQSSIIRILQRKAWRHVKVETNSNRAKCAKTKENLC